MIFCEGNLLRFLHGRPGSHLVSSAVLSSFSSHSYCPPLFLLPSHPFLSPFPISPSFFSFHSYCPFIPSPILSFPFPVSPSFFSHFFCMYLLFTLLTSPYFPMFSLSPPFFHSTLPSYSSSAPLLQIILPLLPCQSVLLLLLLLLPCHHPVIFLFSEPASPLPPLLSSSPHTIQPLSSSSLFSTSNSQVISDAPPFPHFVPLPIFLSLDSLLFYECCD